MSLALTREISAAMGACELTHVSRAPIDVDLAAAQHAAYERALDRLGFTLLRLEPQPDLPDSVFVEDTAVVLREVAIITRPGAESRRPETLSVGEALAPIRPIVLIVDPGTLDGGDVLRVGNRIFVGHSRRTNEDGIRQLRDVVQPLGYAVDTVPVTGCLHLKSAVTAVAPDTLLINPRCVPAQAFEHFRLIAVDAGEPLAANALLARGAVLYPDCFPATAARLLADGIDVRLLALSEIAKAEGGVTCCSLLVDE